MGRALLLLVLSCARAVAAPVSAPEGPVPAVPPSPAAPVWTAPSCAQELQSFLELRHADLIAARPDLLALKLDKARRNDFDFFRAFPELVYLKLKASPAAARLAATPRVRLDGDFHARNVELVAPGDKRPTPQVDDLDDSALGPAALDVARMLAGAALLSSSDDAQPAKLVSEARAAYDGSLSRSFAGWKASLGVEKSVAASSAKDNDWRHHAGVPVADGALAGRLRAAAGLPDDWDVYDRRGAGESSIGLQRYLFSSDAHGHVFELKELRAPAPAFFTKELPEKDGQRLARGYAALRQVPAPVRVVSLDGRDWLLRRRERQSRGLELSAAKSAARVLGGLLGQLHRGQASVAALKAASAAVSDAQIFELVSYVGQARRWLEELLAAGAWRKA